jgi:hypothetical protein
MPGLVPGIHVLLAREQDVDGRDKPGHDVFQRAPHQGECILNGGARLPRLAATSLQKFFR